MKVCEKLNTAVFAFI